MENAKKTDNYSVNKNLGNSCFWGFKTLKRSDCKGLRCLLFANTTKTDRINMHQNVCDLYANAKFAF